METKKLLILEYAKLATEQMLQPSETSTSRMEEIQTELQMTDQSIMTKATELAIATMK